MIVPRETVMSALFALLTEAAPFKTTGRRLILWSKCTDQPAMFLSAASEEYAPRAARGLPPRVTLNVEVWLYVKAGPDPAVAPDMLLNGLIDAIDRALLPAPGQEAQTLGGLVSHAWIEGQIERDPGNIDGQAKAILPVKILGP